MPCPSDPWQTETCIEVECEASSTDASFCADSQSAAEPVACAGLDLPGYEQTAYDLCCTAADTSECVGPDGAAVTAPAPLTKHPPSPPPPTPPPPTPPPPLPLSPPPHTPPPLPASTPCRPRHHSPPPTLDPSPLTTLLSLPNPTPALAPPHTPSSSRSQFSRTNSTSSSVTSTVGEMWPVRLGVQVRVSC